MAFLSEDIIGVARNERRYWADPIVYLTPRVSLRPRVIIEQARKNYLGVFDNPIDKNTGRERLWSPLTEDTVEAIVKNIDLDSKDINIHARNPQGRVAASFLRLFIGNKMEEMNFGRFLNKFIRKACVDGTAIAKVTVNGKKVSVTTPDLLNIFIDPTAPNLEETSSILERHIMRMDEFKAMKGLKDTARVKGKFWKESSVRMDGFGSAPTVNTQVPYIDVWERWGVINKMFITGNEADDGDYVESRVVLSGIDMGEEIIVHLAELNPSGIRPYEEFQYKEIQGRFYGRGVAEMLFNLQAYLNEIINIRMNANRLKQTGLFKVRRGSGITRQDVNALPTGGMIEVPRMEDIQELRQSDQQQSSYIDEQQVRNMANRLVGAFEVSRGENLPASQPATTAVLAQQGAQSGYGLTQESIGFFLQRLFERHLIPALLNTLSEGEVVEIVGNVKELQEFDELVIAQLMNIEAEKFFKRNNRYPSLAEIEKESARLRARFARQGESRYFTFFKKAFSTKFAVEVSITDEKFNKNVMVQNLITLLQNFANIPGLAIDPTEVVLEILDAMNLKSSRFVSTSPSGATQQQTPQQTQPQSPQEQLTQGITQEIQGGA